MNLLWNRHRANLVGWGEWGVYLNLICLAFQHDSCKPLWLLSINVPGESIFGLKNNTDMGISRHKAAMIKLQLKSHMKNYYLCCDVILKLSPITNWTKCLTGVRRELYQIILSLVQSRSLNSLSLL